MMKLREKKGETLVEVLVSIIVAVLSVALLFVSVMSSGNVNRDAKNLDETYYDALSAVDGRTGAPVPTQVTIENPSGASITPPVVVYSDSGLYSYARRTPP